MEIITHLDPDTPTFFADFDQLLMVFKIIFSNAFHAMLDEGQVTVSSRTEGSTLIILSIVDTGIGIPEEDIAKIFQPLFTTKAQGMGLAIAKSIIEGHNGEISVKSEVGKGTIFSMKLPFFR